MDESSSEVPFFRAVCGNEDSLGKKLDWPRYVLLYMTCVTPVPTDFPHNPVCSLTNPCTGKTI